MKGKIHIFGLVYLVFLSMAACSNGAKTNPSVADSLTSATSREKTKTSKSDQEQHSTTSPEGKTEHIQEENKPGSSGNNSGGSAAKSDGTTPKVSSIPLWIRSSFHVPNRLGSTFVSLWADDKEKSGISIVPPAQLVDGDLANAHIEVAVESKDFAIQFQLEPSRDLFMGGPPLGKFETGTGLTLRVPLMTRVKPPFQIDPNLRIPITPPMFVVRESTAEPTENDADVGLTIERFSDGSHPRILEKLWRPVWPATTQLQNESCIITNLDSPGPGANAYGIEIQKDNSGNAVITESALQKLAKVQDGFTANSFIACKSSVSDLKTAGGIPIAYSSDSSSTIRRGVTIRTITSTTKGIEIPAQTSVTKQDRPPDRRFIAKLSFTRVVTRISYRTKNVDEMYDVTYRVRMGEDSVFNDVDPDKMAEDKEGPFVSFRLLADPKTITIGLHPEYLTSFTRPLVGNLSLHDRMTPSNALILVTTKDSNLKKEFFIPPDMKFPTPPILVLPAEDDLVISRHKSGDAKITGKINKIEMGAVKGISPFTSASCYLVFTRPEYLGKAELEVTVDGENLKLTEKGLQALKKEADDPHTRVSTECRGVMKKPQLRTEGNVLLEYEATSRFEDNSRLNTVIETVN